MDDELTEIYFDCDESSWFHALESGVFLDQWKKLESASAEKIDCHILAIGRGL